MIRLYYIKNISDTDTLFFEGSSNTYFDNHYVIRFDDAFYPPLYKNKIILPISNLIFPVNYLSLEYDYKIYYYFIDKVTYIDEVDVELDIRMDTITTFFDKDFVINKGSIIEREFIDRWINTGGIKTINKNYIRENVSKGVFKLNSKLNLSPRDFIDSYSNSNVNSSHLFVVKMISNQLSGMVTEFPLIRKAQFNIEGRQGPTVVPQCAYYVFPIRKVDDMGSAIKIPTTDNLVNNSHPYAGGDIKNTYLESMLYKFERENNVIESYVLPGNPLSDSLTFDSTNGVYVLGHCLGGVADASSGYQDWGTPFAVLIRKDDSGVTNPSETINLYSAHRYSPVGINIVVNPTDTTPYDAFNITQLMDENYIRKTFGNSDNYAVAPLHLMNSPLIYECTLSNIFDGTIKFWFKGQYDISYAQQYGINDNNNSMVTVKAPVVDVMLDAWQDYYSKNKLSLLAGITAGSIGVASGRPIMGALALGGALAHRTETSINKFESPDSIKTLGNHIDSTLDGNTFYISTVSYVDDIDAVAWYYHLNGYLTMRPLTEDMRFIYLGGAYGPRRHFNYWKFKEIYLKENRFIPTELLEDIKARFLKGVRFWNIRDNTTCIYDNVIYDNYEI